MNKVTVAVIGAGVQGLAAIKNLSTEGFEVVGFEDRSTIGGVWQFDESPNRTSVLPSTILNTSKYRNAFTDFPVPDEYPPYMTVDQTLTYINSYAEHFSLRKYIHLNTKVINICRNINDTKWEVTFRIGGDFGLEDVKEFDKVVVCTGENNEAYVPVVEGRDKFKGEVIHSQAFKRPSDYKDKKVLVVGIGNTAVDASCELADHAQKVYLSHRNGNNVFTRFVQGKPVDLHRTRRGDALGNIVSRIAPSFAKSQLDAAVKKAVDISCGQLNSSWRLRPSPSILTHLPIISDKFIPCLNAGTVISVHGLRNFVSEKQVQLDDNTVLEVDVVIFCTGYIPNCRIIPSLDLLRSTPYSKMENQPLPRARLYQNIFPPSRADSVAFLSSWNNGIGVPMVGDLASMAIAEVWKARYRLPSEEEMEKKIDEFHGWIVSVSMGLGERMGRQAVPIGWMEWLNEVAGTGCNEKLGYGWEGWKFWLGNMGLCNLMMSGVESPHFFRLFDGRRKRWDGAEEAIRNANRNAKLYTKGRNEL